MPQVRLSRSGGDPPGAPFVPGSVPTSTGRPRGTKRAVTPANARTPDFWLWTVLQGPLVTARDQPLRGLSRLVMRVPGSNPDVGFGENPAYKRFVDLCPLRSALSPPADPPTRVVCEPRGASEPLRPKNRSRGNRPESQGDAAYHGKEALLGRALGRWGHLGSREAITPPCSATLSVRAESDRPGRRCRRFCFSSWLLHKPPVRPLDRF